ncbi:hypothetical protein O2W15_07320 [Modestobacter sp. VKM Ac-2979]|uniref:hypothetical protein n=1 Tax=unclassified Modestobacter TaxID=2643866 RepID=UPI0022AB9D1B|nr:MULTISPECIES: hypothetical protein [unclassified Modestobacter]MCZ2811246.1 hypothetical protein [Modestobacter sp. VKM Ac-2979]MCZ2840759.1 hypothetical protein [Modestobacter sp. VKM Ac-2980]
MSGAGSGRTARHAQLPEPLGMPTLLRWRRIGLTAGTVAVLAVLGFLAVAVVQDGVGRLVSAFVLVSALVCALAALSFLRRAWAEPEVADDPQVVRARRWAGIASTSWLLAIVPGLAVRLLPESFDWLRWLVLALGASAALAFTAMLVLTARWCPAR